MTEHTVNDNDLAWSPKHPATNVVVLFAADNTSRGQFERSVAQWNTSGYAVLVVFSRVADQSTLERVSSAGADLCVVAPTPTELFTHVEQARTRHRRASNASIARGAFGCDHGSGTDQLLDAFWIKHSGHLVRRSAG